MARSTVQAVDAVLYVSSGGDVVASQPNEETTALASAERTATTNGGDLTNVFARGVRLHLNISAASGTNPTLDVKVQTKDSVSAAYVDLTGAAFAQKTTTGSDDLVIYPGIGETANRAVSDALSRTWRVVATIGGTNPSFTFSVGAAYIQ